MSAEDRYRQRGFELHVYTIYTYVYIYIYVYMCVIFIYVYIYIYMLAQHILYYNIFLDESFLLTHCDVIEN